MRDLTITISGKNLERLIFFFIIMGLLLIYFVPKWVECPSGIAEETYEKTGEKSEEEKTNVKPVETDKITGNVVSNVAGNQTLQTEAESQEATIEKEVEKKLKEINKRKLEAEFEELEKNVVLWQDRIMIREEEDYNTTEAKKYLDRIKQKMQEVSNYANIEQYDVALEVVDKIDELAVKIEDSITSMQKKIVALSGDLGFAVLDINFEAKGETWGKIQDVDVRISNQKSVGFTPVIRLYIYDVNDALDERIDQSYTLEFISTGETKQYSLSPLDILGISINEISLLKTTRVELRDEETNSILETFTKSYNFSATAE